MPTNLFGPGNNYHPENSHVIPALIRRFHEAKTANSPAVTIGVPAHLNESFCI
jgi:GDP-L-fucose synthase